MKPKLLLYLYLVIILLLMVLPINREESFLNDIYIVHIRLDYITHMLVFLPYLFLFRRVYSAGIIPSLILGCLFAAFSEYIQYLLPYRAFNINDLIGNVIGIVTGSILLIPAINVFLTRVVFFRKKE